MIYGHKNLPKKYLNQKKIIRKIDSYKNDKTSLSLNRLIQEQFKNERYGIRVRGETEDVLPIKYEDLNKYYRILKTNDCDVVISGDISEEELSLVNKYFKKTKTS